MSYWKFEARLQVARRKGARHGAEEIVRVLNAGGTRKSIEVRVASFKPDPSFRGQIAVWAAAFFMAVILGGVWELSGTFR